MQTTEERTAAAIRAVSDTTVSERRILIVPLSTITHTPYNPSARTKEGARLNRLVETIKKNGLIYPILITSDRSVIDGNRRLTACRALGHETIECVVSDLDRDEAFTTINTSSMRLGGKGWLDMASRGGVLPPKESAQYEELRNLVGSYGINLLIKQNLGLNILALCKQVAALGVKRRLEDIILEVATKRLTNKINAELRADKTAEKKITAINRLLRAE
jgi:hypothetical protein